MTLKWGKSSSIPKHLKNGSPDYLYPHNYPFEYVKQQYLPDSLKNRIYYHPKPIVSMNKI